MILKVKLIDLLNNSEMGCHYGRDLGYRFIAHLVVQSQDNSVPQITSYEMIDSVL